MHLGVCITCASFSELIRTNDVVLFAGRIERKSPNYMVIDAVLSQRCLVRVLDRSHQCSQTVDGGILMSDRYCPICDESTDALDCAKHNVPTVLSKPGRASVIVYEAGEVIDASLQ